MLVNFPVVIGFRAVVVGEYSDVVSRILEVTVRPPLGEHFLFPNQPGGIGSLRTFEDGYLAVGLDGTRKDPNVSGQWIVRVDRGYLYELNGEAQPDTYFLPAEGGLLLHGSSNSVGLEAFLYNRALATVAPEVV